MRLNQYHNKGIESDMSNMFMVEPSPTYIKAKLEERSTILLMSNLPQSRKEFYLLELLVLVYIKKILAPFLFPEVLLHSVTGPHLLPPLANHRDARNICL